MKTLADIGRQCFISRNKTPNSKPRLVICPSCGNKNVVRIIETTLYVDCLKCKDVRIELKKEPWNE